MSDIFHKSCYTSRSSGYKYRTLSTNTGEKNKRDDKDDSTFEKKFKDLKSEISTRIDQQLNQTQKARESIQEKFVNIDSKINSMLELQNTVAILRKDLQSAESALIGIMEKVNKLEASGLVSEDYSLHSKRTSFRSQSPIMEEKEIYSSSMKRKQAMFI